MKLLLDTNIFLWAVTLDPRMSPRARDLYLAEKNDLYLSVVSIWEIVTKVQIGKLKLPVPIEEYLKDQLIRNRLELLPVRVEHAFRLNSLPLLHRDPFDRMLLAQSLEENMPLLSGDAKLRQYSAQVIW